MRYVIAIVIAATLAIAGYMAAGALAHEGSITIDCDGVTFSFVKFENETNTVHETVNGVTTDFTFDGPEGSNVVPIPEGATTVTAEAHWEGQTIPDGPVTVELDCESTPPDACPNLDGVQDEIPEGYHWGALNPDAQDRPIMGCIPDREDNPPPPPPADCPPGFHPWHGKCYKDDSQPQPNGTVIYGEQG